MLASAAQETSWIGTKPDRHEVRTGSFACRIGFAGDSFLRIPTIVVPVDARAESFGDHRYAF
jgi:hypothetical protein